jgi:GNAT superfamily N-acetyltransferase
MLASLAEDPEYFVTPPAGSRRVAEQPFCLTIGPHGRWAGVCRLRLPADDAVIADVVASIRRLTEGIAPVIWNLGSSSTPDDLPRRLRDLGLRDPDPPLDPVVSALTIDRPPPASPDVEVAIVDSFEQHVAGLEIMLASDEWPERAAAAERARAREVFELRRQRDAPQWLAMLDGRPVAYAAADVTPAGLFLSGGATLPEARGRGCYRALVRARWDDSARRGTPGLAVQAQHGSSAPILRRLGFVDVATVHTLQDGAADQPASRSAASSAASST